MSTDTYALKFSRRSVQYFLRKVANRQTDKCQVLHNLVGGGNNQENVYAAVIMTKSMQLATRIHSVHQTEQHQVWQEHRLIIDAPKDVLDIRNVAYFRNESVSEATWVENGG